MSTFCSNPRLLWFSPCLSYKLSKQPAIKLSMCEGESMRKKVWQPAILWWSSTLSPAEIFCFAKASSQWWILLQFPPRPLLRQVLRAFHEHSLGQKQRCSIAQFSSSCRLPAISTRHPSILSDNHPHLSAHLTTQVMDSIFWVRCASGNVFAPFPWEWLIIFTFWGKLVTFDGPLSLYVGLSTQYQIHTPPPPSWQCQDFHVFFLQNPSLWR